MAIDSEELVIHLRQIAPRELEEDWDNGGYQIFLGKKYIEKILICLEITNAVIDEAVRQNIDFIVTHHPLIFKGLSVIDQQTIEGNYIIRLIKSGISVYSAHTSFDSVFGGNNDYLADLLDLETVRKLKTWTPNGEVESVGRIGSFREPITLEDAAEKVEKILKLTEKVRVVGDPDKSIVEVAICTGAGTSSIDAVLKNNCDLFITGDVTHHTAQKAKESGLAVIDAGHYGTEKIFSENFAEKLKKATEDKVEIIESNVIVNPFNSMVY